VSAPYTMAEVDATGPYFTPAGTHAAMCEVGRLRATVAALASVTAERDEARAEMAHKVEEYRLITNAAVAEKARADAAEVREAALRAALVECVAALRSAPATVRYGAWAEGTRANAIAHGDAALAAPDPGAWVRREELDREKREADFVIEGLKGTARLLKETQGTEMKRVAEAAWDAGYNAGTRPEAMGSRPSPAVVKRADLAALLEGTR